MKKQIEVRDLWFSYGKTPILEHVDLDVYEGDFLALIGPNGGGKTTLIKLLLGLRTPKRGTIRILGTTPAKARSRIGYLPQYINFNMDLPINVIDIVMQGRLKKNKLFYDARDREIAYAQMRKMKIASIAHRKIKELSGGQRQRVLLARALCMDPEILILDEPTASIDPKGQKEIYALLKELPQTKIIVSHDINILFEGVNRVAHINKTLYMHERIQTALHPRKGHFCEVELLDILKGHEDG